jgi:N-acetylglucosamine-6-sulfatase
LTEYAVNWLRQNGTQQPFMLYLAHKAPHLPSEPMPRHAAALAGDSIPEPATFDDTFKDKPAWQRRYVVCGGAAAAFSQCPDPLPAQLPLWQWSPDEPWRLDYLRTLMDLDDSVGSIQATLSSLGIADSTYVLFLSDNGFLFGDHRMADKRVAYEESMRIPFVMSGGGLTPRQANGVALNIDIAPTFLELASVARPATMQGLSLVKLLRGEAESVRDAFLYEYFAEPLVPVVPSIQALRSGTRKYVTYPGAASDEELYDLVGDPRELTNVAARPDWGAAREAARQQLDRLLAETGAVR